MNGEYQKWDTAGTGIREYVRFKVVTVLNSINYFEGKKCKDCGYFDIEKKVCFVEENEYTQLSVKSICGFFSPKELVEVKT